MTLKPTIAPPKRNNLDVRSRKIEFTTRDVTKNGNTQHVISGYAVVFDQPSQPMPFIEVIDKHAFDSVDLSDVKLLYSHDFANILARTDAGALTLKVDNTGVFFTATLPDTTLGHDVFTDIQNGNLKGMSFGFLIEDDNWGIDQNGQRIHTITAISKCAEISITSLPAYQETSIQVQRSLERQNVKDNENTEGVINLADKNENPVEAPVEAPTDEAKPTQPAPKESPAKKEADDTDLQKLLDEVHRLESLIKPASETPDDEPEDEDEPADPAPDKRDDDNDDSTTVSDDDDSDDEALEEDSEHTKLEKRDNQMKTISTKPEDMEVRNFTQFLQTRDMSIVDGTTTKDNGVAIPQQILQSIEKPANTNALVSLVNRISVSAPAGKIPVMSATDVVLPTAEELAANPDLAKLALAGVNYALKTHRGAIPVSQELLDDADSAVQLQKLIGDYATQIHDNTLSADVATALKTAKAVSATSLDDLKKAYNATYKYSNRVIVVTESAFDALDTLKDNEGRYLLQDSISAPTGKQLFGAPVYVVEDTRLGKAGDQLAFVGSVHSFAVLADYKDLRVQFVDDYAYGTQLVLIVREDVEVADPDAGSLVTLNFSAPVSK